jgi:hypothetical protein
MRRKCGMHLETENEYMILWENFKENDHPIDLHVDGEIYIKMDHK